MALATSILCAIDFSTHAERALRHAVALAGSSGAHLTLIAVNDPVLVAASAAAGHRDTLRGQVKAALEATLTAMPSHPAVIPAIDVVDGLPGPAILDAAARASADLIVMGTRGLGAAGRAVFGSTAERVLRSATMPVLVVPEYEPECMRVDHGASRFSVHDVLTAVGFDPNDAAVVERAVAWKEGTGADLTLAHVSPAAPAPAWWPFGEALPAEPLETAMAQLAHVARTIDGATPSHLEVRRGAVDATLAELAHERASGLIVLSRGGAMHRVGAIASRVIAVAKVPTLVVPGPVTQ